MLHFEDKGQDFLRWTVKDGVVVNCEPFQGWLWNGTKVIDMVEVGSKPIIVTPHGQPSELKYKIIRIERHRKGGPK